MNNLCLRAKEVNKKICTITNRPVNLIIASKYADSSQLKELVDCGFNVFGENRVQDLLKKAEYLTNVQWHFIGHLQKNKVKYIIGHVELIQSLDSIELARIINKEASKKGIEQKLLIQVNIAREEQKFGVLPEELDLLVKETLKLNNITIKGLMAIMPFKPVDVIRPYFKELYKKFENIKAKFPSGQFEYLSVGMSNDWEIALLEGSNMIRLGSVIFGG